MESTDLKKARTMLLGSVHLDFTQVEDISGV